MAMPTAVPPDPSGTTTASGSARAARHRLDQLEARPPRSPRVPSGVDAPGHSRYGRRGASAASASRQRQPASDSGAATSHRPHAAGGERRAGRRTSSVTGCGYSTASTSRPSWAA